MCPTLSSSSAILSALQRSSLDTTLWHEITSTTTHMTTGSRKCEHGILWNISLAGDTLYDGSKYTEQYYAQQEFVDGETTRLFGPSRREIHFLFDRNNTWHETTSTVRDRDTHTEKLRQFALCRFIDRTINYRYVSRALSKGRPMRAHFSAHLDRATGLSAVLIEFLWAILIMFAPRYFSFCVAISHLTFKCVKSLE